MIQKIDKLKFGYNYSLMDSKRLFRDSLQWTKINLFTLISNKFYLHSEYLRVIKLVLSHNELLFNITQKSRSQTISINKYNQIILNNFYTE